MQNAASLFCMLACLIGAAPLYAQDMPPASDFVARHHQIVLDCLRQIHAHPMTERDRFIAIAEIDRPYVQCLFHDNDTMIYCEAASGAYDDELARNITPATIAAIKQQGFVEEAAKNFNQDRAVDSDATLSAIATMMLQTLHQAYNAQSDDLEINAPFCGFNDRVS